MDFKKILGMSTIIIWGIGFYWTIYGAALNHWMICTDTNLYGEGWFELLVFTFLAPFGIWWLTKGNEKNVRR